MNKKTMKEKPVFQLNRRQSIIFLVVYGAVTMAVRFYIEPFLAGNFWLSTGIGLVLLGVIFLLIKTGVLNFSDETGGTSRE
jgi:predicted phage tail protein